MNYRRKANIVLATVFCIFLIATMLRRMRPESASLHFFYFVSEAALVGGLADWFAVTAIFRKPLGWPYHTALIPRNRDKMISGIIAMVQDELLSESLIRKKLEDFKITSKLIGYVEKSGGATFLAKLLRQKLEGFLTDKKATAKFEKVLKEKVIETGSAKQILVFLRQQLEKETFPNWLNKRIEDGIDLVSGPMVRTKILEVLETFQTEQVAGGGKLQNTLLGFLQASDTLNLDEAADAIQIELILHTRELTDPNHPVRDQLKEVLKVKLLQLEEDPEVLNTIEHWKNTLVQEVSISELVLSIINEENRISDETSISEKAKTNEEAYGYQANLFDDILEHWWSDFKDNAQLQMLMDKVFHDMIINILQSEHTIVGQITRETLEGLSDEELNHFIEDKAGNDLQWIRINGSLVGGVVGAIMFVILNYGYAPLLEMIR